MGGHMSNAACLTRRCSRPAAGDAHQLATQPCAAGLLNGSLVRCTREATLMLQPTAGRWDPKEQEKLDALIVRRIQPTCAA